jgi:DNA-binding beta-propeller fold protein YncE
MTSLALAALVAFTVEPDQPSTLVYPPYGHCMGIYRAGTEQLNMLLGGMVTFDDPQGLAAVKLSEWDSPEPSDDDELAVYGVNSGPGQIIYNASMYALGFYDGGGRSADRLSSPHGIAASPAGDVYVADTGNGRVAVLSRRGARIKPSSYIRGLEEPWGVALDGRAIWVTDRAGGTLCRYASPEDQAPQTVSLNRPRGVAATGYERWSSGHQPFQAVVVDDGLALVKVVDGRVVERVTPGDCGGSFFNYPAIDYHGNVWVTDSVSCRIHKFSPSLDYLASYGRGFGSADDQFEHPTGIAIWTRFGQVFIAERAGARYFWVGTDIRNFTVGPRNRGLTVSGLLTEPTILIVNVLDARGSVVRNLRTGNTPVGQFSYSWDGTTLGGAHSPAGQYTLVVTAEATYSSRTYFSKTWRETFTLGEPAVEPDSSSRGERGL